MKRNLAFLSSCFSFSLVVVGCIDPKEIGNTEEGTSTGEETAGEESSGSTGGASSSSASGPMTTSTSDPSESGTGSSSVGEGESATESGTGSSSAAESGTDTTGGEDPQALCEQTGGTWDELSCDHYTCGFFPDCDAVIPGCDCGLGSTFVEGVGCMVDESCEELEFACGPDLTCGAPGEYCDVFVPGVKGPNSYACAVLPDACVGDYSCDCIVAEDYEDVKEIVECSDGPSMGITVTVTGA